MHDVENDPSWGDSCYGAVLLTTGANEDRNSKMNIVDLAGNVCEWTLEASGIYSSHPCVCRGGSYFSINEPAVRRYWFSYMDSGDDGSIGFRVSLY